MTKKQKPSSVDEVCDVEMKSTPRLQNDFPYEYTIEFKQGDHTFPVRIKLDVDTYQSLLDRYGNKGKGELVIREYDKHTEIILYVIMPYRGGRNAKKAKSRP